MAQNFRSYNALEVLLPPHVEEMGLQLPVLSADKVHIDPCMLLTFLSCNYFIFTKTGMPITYSSWLGAYLKV